MRHECQVDEGNGTCGKLSVESVPDASQDDGRFWLCADHWDELQADSSEDEDGYYSYEFGR
jgi:hypothetical protein